MSDPLLKPDFSERPLLVVALGGNALSPPDHAAAGHDADDYELERGIVTRSAALLNQIATQGYRLLIVHGNGPQVGRLLRQDPARANLDIHIAQTQGELGYLLVNALDAPSACLLTRVVVSDAAGPPVKPVGPVLRERPAQGTSTAAGTGWRLTVASPKPERVIEQEAIAHLLEHRHVIAGGGGGVPTSRSGIPVEGVVDKDWVASLLAVRLDARHLLFATDVAGVYPHHDQQDGPPIARLSVASARELIRNGTVSAGSMAPKLESAAEFAAATGRPASICR